MSTFLSSFKYEDNLKNEDNLKYEDNLKNEEDLKNEDDIKNENDIKHEDDPKIGTPLQIFFAPPSPWKLPEIFLDDFSPWQPHHNWC